MDIRKIIKEEIDDFKWVGDVEEYQTLTRKMGLEIGQKYYIDYRIGYDNERLKVPVVFRSNPSRGASSYAFTGPDEEGNPRNYLFFGRSTGAGGIYDMIERGEVFYKKSELKENFDWTEEIGKDFDVCDLVNMPRDIVGQDIIITYGGYGPRKSTTNKQHFNVPAKVVSVTQPWNEDIRLHLKAKRPGWTPDYIGCGWRFKFTS